MRNPSRRYDYEAVGAYREEVEKPVTWDAHLLKGPKRYVGGEDLIGAVLECYPGAIAHGAIWSYHFLNGDDLIAEAWMHRTRPGWWLRIKQPTSM